MRIWKALDVLIRQDDGTEMVEYALIGALVSVVALGVVRLIGV